MVPGHFQITFTEADIARQIKRVGSEISVWAKKIWDDSHTDVVAVPVLRGGIFFFSDLVRSVTTSVEIAPVKTWGYVEGENEQKLAKVKVESSMVPAKGRRILLIDDICDSGRTLEALSEHFIEAGALEVRSCVLIKRVIEEETFNPTWVCFEYNGPEWFVGYGMEDSGRWRNLPAVYTIRQK
ncbi:MAG: hypothetical protein KDD53_06045 [Bdellovibrionales bacterium]|nr:hypothetical protein [Bdellovibrionales bacterium]